MSAIDFYIGICVIISNAWAIYGKGSQAVFWALMAISLVVGDLLMG